MNTPYYRATRIEAGEDIMSVVARHPPGSLFLLTGVHKEQTIRLREGDRFIRADDCVLVEVTVTEGESES